MAKYVAVLGSYIHNCIFVFIYLFIFFSARLPVPAPSRRGLLCEWKMSRRKPPQPPVQKAGTGGRGATEFGPARESSAAKLPLPAAADEVD